MHPVDDLFAAYARSFEANREAEMSLPEYLEACRDNPMMYATATERLLAAIGEPEMVDTSKDARLGRIFMNRTIRVYPAFYEFYGMEETIERIVGFLRHAAQGLEERKQIMYLLGPVGGGKSSLAERLKALMEVHPIYVLKAGDQLSPVFESPLGLFNPERMGADAGRSLRHSAAPADRTDEPVVHQATRRIRRRHLALPGCQACCRRGCARSRIAKTEPGDENNQDISSLVGKVDIRKLELHAQNDPDAYSYSGGLNRANQGLLEFVEMFKAPIKMLHPLLTATQEGNYIGTENIGAIPFSGIILAHSNEAEWQTFKNNRNNEAFIDRIYVIKVPYCLRVTEEQKIYDKLVRSSELAESPCAPATLEMLARFSVLTRLRRHENSTLFAKMRVYDGESLKETDPRARIAAGIQGLGGRRGRHGRRVHPIRLQGAGGDVQPRHDGNRGRSGASDVCAGAVDPPRTAAGGNREALSGVHQGRTGAALRRIHRQRNPEGLSGIVLTTTARTCSTATCPMPMPGSRTSTSRMPDTGQLLNRELLNQELTKIEKPAGIANPKDFRNEVVKFSLRARANNNGKNPSWTSYEKIREVIERRMFSQVEELAAGDQLRLEEGQRNREEARGVRRAHDRPRLHRAAGPPPGRVVHAGEAGGLSRTRHRKVRQAHAHRRPAPQPQRQEPRQPAAVHAPGQVADPQGGA